jgi:hypothetical protein
MYTYTRRTRAPPSGVFAHSGVNPDHVNARIDATTPCNRNRNDPRPRIRHPDSRGWKPTDLPFSTTVFKSRGQRRGAGHHTASTYVDGRSWLFCTNNPSGAIVDRGRAVVVIDPTPPPTRDDGRMRARSRTVVQVPSPIPPANSHLDGTTAQATADNGQPHRRPHNALSAMLLLQIPVRALRCCAYD